MHKLVGVLGGMGPEATSDFIRKLTYLTPVETDQEHIPIIATSIPDIPDRTKNILGQGPSPLNAMLRSLKLLEMTGAEIIVIPCNTAHFWLEKLESASNIKFLSMIDSVIEEAKLLDSVAIFATTGTIICNLYQEKLRTNSIKYILPEKEEQNKIMSAILEIKSGRHHNAEDIISQIVKDMALNNKSGIILACTELSLLLPKIKNEYPSLPIIDSTESLARKTIKWFFSDKENYKMMEVSRDQN